MEKACENGILVICVLHYGESACAVSPSSPSPKALGDDQ